MTIRLDAAAARGPLRDGVRAALKSVTVEHERGVLGILGGPKDGTSLLLDVLDGTARLRAGRASVLGAPPGAVAARIARVSLDAPLPDALRVDEVCDLSADLRGHARRPAREVLGALGVGALAPRRVRSLSTEERRVVALALALASNAEVLLVEEPLCRIDPAAAHRVVAALRARGRSSCVIVTTTSARDAVDVGDRLGILTAGAYVPIAPERAYAGLNGRASIRVVVAASNDRDGAASLLEALGREEAVAHVDASVATHGFGVAHLVAYGPELRALARAVTRGIGAARADVLLVEPAVLPIDRIRATVEAARARAGELTAGAGELTADGGAEIGTAGAAPSTADTLTAGANTNVPSGPAPGATPRASRACAPWGLARAPLARVLRTRRAWLPALGLAALGIVGAVAARASHSTGADHVLGATFGPLVLPLLAYMLVSSTFGGVGLGASVRGSIALGARPERAALVAAVAATLVTAFTASLLGALLCVVAHGPLDAPLSADVPATLGVGFLGGAAYGAYFCVGSALGRGVMRGGLLILDVVLGTVEGFGSAFTPRAHVMSLLGGLPCLELSRRASSVALVGIVLVGLALVARLARRRVG